VGIAPYSELADDLYKLLSPRTSQELQVATVRLLAEYSDSEIAERLLADWRGYSPPVQFVVAEACVNNVSRLPALFDAIESGTLPPTQLSPLRRTLLMKHSNAQIRERALQLFSDSVAGPRKEILQTYLSALKETGDAMRGKRIFEKQCQICHKLGSTGHNVGPSLATIKHRRTDEILTAILDPNREIGPNFVQYAILLNDGRTATGMIAEETAAGVTLMQQESKTEVILRSNIEEISNTGISLMPEGLEKNISVEEMSDLLFYLRSP
jgi:putative heme-binding domain-containing protein